MIKLYVPHYDSDKGVWRVVEKPAITTQPHTHAEVRCKTEVARALIYGRLSNVTVNATILVAAACEFFVFFGANRRRTCAE